jgi:hypothetical protein
MLLHRGLSSAARNRCRTDHFRLRIDLFPDRENLPYERWKASWLESRLGPPLVFDSHRALRFHVIVIPLCSLRIDRVVIEWRKESEQVPERDFDLDRADKGQVRSKIVRYGTRHNLVIRQRNLSPNPSVR